MAIQYYMRAFNTTSSQYVDWVVNDTPDSTGTFSGFPTNQLIDITVNRVVQSKVSNFLKQNQSLGGTDGYYFHVNSYDWRNAVAPINPPTNLVGFAVERGIVAVTSVTTASNATPIVITSSSPHGLVTGQIVTITGVTGNIAANGTWPIIVTNGTQFQLVGSSGNANYVSGGNIFIPRTMSTLTWDEINSRWRFVQNTNGDGYTLGSSQDVVMNSLFLDGYIAIGPDPADVGAIRLSNNTFITSEINPSGSPDLQLIGGDNLNRIKLGSVVGDIVYTPGAIDVDGYIVHDGNGTNAATVGFIREQNNTTIIAFRAASLASDIIALSSNSANNVILGDAANAGTIHNTATGNVHQFQVNSAPQFEIGTAFVRFTQLVNAPQITQTAAGVGISGQTLTIQAQNAGTGSTTGGTLSLVSGSSANVHGNVTITLGNEANAKATFYPTANAGANSNTILFNGNILRFGSNQSIATQTNPLIRQDDTATSSATGQTLTLQAQNTTGSSSTGGALNLTSGTGTTASGRVNVQTGGTTQIIVSPTFIAPGTSSGSQTSGSVIILGNLEVVGTTTTVDSTVVDIIGRVIHSNWADPSASPNVAVPSQMVGYAVHRGNSSGFARDGAAWIWTEGTQTNGSDGYWRAQTNPGDGYGTDNFTAANSTNAVGVMANAFAPTPDPNPVAGTLPSQGSIRAPNNLPNLVARNVSPTTTISATSNLQSLPQATINVASTTGFATPSGSLLIFSDAGTQTVTYTGTTGTTFTGAVGGTGTLHTGSYVAQTNKSTTIAAGSNNVALPQGTINVASTVGFPTTGTIRVVTSVSNSNGNTLSVQTVTYTGTGATTFTGCTGGTGTMFTGNSVTSPPIPGTNDLVLVGTDFGNRVLWGSPSNLNGHIFNTPTNTLFDFQVNSIPQIRIQANDTNADGYVEVFEIEPTVSNPRLAQLVRPDTGANAGFNLVLQAQNGQSQTGATANNNGGNIVIASGSAGTGGTASPAVPGTVDLQTDSTLKVRIFPTFSVNAPDNNSILINENLLRIDPAQNTPLIRQDSTTNANGQSFTLQAQNAATRGGPLLLTSGTGPGSLDGYVDVVTGTTLKARFFPTFAQTASDNSTMLFFENIFRFDTSLNVPLIRQDSTAGASGQSLTLQAQNAATTGGPLLITSGTGATNDGYINLITGSTVKMTIFPTTAVTAANNNSILVFENKFRFDTAQTTPLIRQDDNTNNGATATSLTLQAANATGTTSTGGALVVTSGTGTTTAGNTQIQTGGVDRIIVHPAFTEFRDTAEALRITPVSAGTTQITYAATVTAAQINQTQTATAPAPMTIQSQVTTGNTVAGGNLNLVAGNSTGTTTLGGDGYFSSGTGTTSAGNIHLQTGGTDRVIVHPTFTELRDTAEAVRITPVSAGTTQMLFASTVTAVSIKQTDLSTASGTGAATTIQAQNEIGATSVGGALNLTSGTGTTNGAVNLQVGGTTTASLVTNKFVFNKGRRRNVTAVNTTYLVLTSDDYIAVTASTVYTITLPATPTTGDIYEFKDINGTSGTNTVTISGNGANIDGAASITLNANFASLVVIYTGAQWSVS